MTIRPLTSWGAIIEKQQLHIYGLRQDGKQIVTSAVVRQLGPATYETKSGSVYRLIGEVRQEYRAFRGITDAPAIDPDNPINFKPETT